MKKIMISIIIALILFSHISASEEEENIPKINNLESLNLENNITENPIIANIIEDILIENNITTFNQNKDFSNDDKTNIKINETIITQNEKNETEMSENSDTPNNYSEENENLRIIHKNITESEESENLKESLEEEKDLGNEKENQENNALIRNNQRDSEEGGYNYNYLFLTNISNNSISNPPSQDHNENEKEIKNLQEKIFTKCILKENPNNGYEGILSGCNNIILEINEINENEKEIKISSEDEINEPFTIFLEVPKIKDINSLKIFWINNNKEISEKNFEDIDSDGYYEKVLWTIPHLSNQYYKIIFNFTRIENNEKNKMELNIISPLNESVLQNPIQFIFNISYYNLTNLECSFSIDNILSLETIGIGLENLSITWPENLENGNHEWTFLCKDKSNDNIKDSISGNFIVNENFSINPYKKVYFLGENVSVKIYSKNNTYIELINPNNIRIYNQTLSGIYPKEINLTSTNFTLPGKYKINITTDYFAKPYSLTEEVNLIEINFTSNKKNLTRGEFIDFQIMINSPIPNFCYFLYFGDNNQTNECVLSNSLQKSITYAYKNQGLYNPKLEIRIDSINLTFNISAINVTNVIDTENPIITLLNPNEDAYLKNNSVIFSYKAKDNVKISNCTFSLYEAVGNYWSYTYNENSLIKRIINSTITNDEIIQIQINSLPEKNYIWEVNCSDNSTNINKNWRFFTINLSENSIGTSSTTTQISNQNNSYNISYEQKQEVENVINLLNDFLEKQENYTLDQKQVLEDLEISKNLNYFKKRLIQISQDFSYNLENIKDSNLKEQRKQELIQEFQNISLQIPLDLEIINQKEFIKNSLSLELKTFIKNYLSLYNLFFKDSELKKLAEENFKIQNDLEVLTNVKQIRIKYINKTIEETLVTKNIKIKNESYEKILEVFPKEIYEKYKIEFLTPNEEVNNSGIYEINTNDIENNKIVYLIKELVDLKELEKIDTLLYKEFIIKKNNKITGYSVLEINFSKWSYYITFLFLFVVVLYLLISLSKSRKIKKWKKQEAAKKLFSLINQSKKMMKEKEIENLRDNYHKIKELYQQVPNACKKYVYKEIKKIQEFIDKKEIEELIKELEIAKKERRIEDAKRIYERIKSDYSRLPKKEKKKINNKFFKKKI
ncbi:MAG: hypothetical protein QXW97_00090 [Candidatus Pacearchaeota archaeon]